MLAQEYGVGVVAAAHGIHFGAATLYARMAAQKGMIGLCLSNVQLSWSCPCGRMGRAHDQLR
jgi:LDH2 family malate/lactate/ureidoglycolate dehydrogenase